MLKNKTVSVVDPNHQYLGFMGVVTADADGHLEISVDDGNTTYAVKAHTSQIEVVDSCYLQ